MNKPSRLQIGLYLSSLLLMVALALREWDNYTVGFFLDDGQYVILAQSLLTSASYGWYFMPAALQQPQLPFGLPLLLAPLTALFPGQYDVLRFVPLGASVVSVSVLFWGWSRLTRVWSYWWALVVAALFALSPLTILYSRVVLSEAVFLAFALACILFTERAAARVSRWDPVWLGALAVGLVYTRTIGWIVLGALCVYLVLRLRVQVWRPLVLAAIGGLVVVGVVLVLTPVGPRDLVPNEYLRFFTNQVTRDATAIPGARPYLLGQILGTLSHLDFTDWLPSQFEVELKQLLASTGLEPLRYVPGVVLLAVLAYGFVGWFRKGGLSAFLIVVPPYVLSLLLWAWDGARFIFPIQPQLLFALVIGTYGIANAVMQRIPDEGRWRVPAVASLLGVMLVAEVLVNLRSGTWFVPRDVHGADVEWIARETAPDTVLMVPVPTTYYLYVRRNFIPYPAPVGSVQDMVRQIRTYRAEYVIAPAFGIPVNAYVDDRSRTALRHAGYLEELLTRGVLHQRFVHLPADAVIYQVIPERLALEPE